MERTKLTFIILIFISACNSADHQLSSEELAQYRRDLTSKEVNKICVAAYHLGEAHDTLSVPALLKNLDDPRISHHIQHKGMSVYYCKAGALRKISGLDIEIKQHNPPDSAIIKRFIIWANDNKLRNVQAKSDFSISKWQTKKGKTYPHRAEMYKDVLYNDTIRKLNEQEILALLGEPDRKQDGYFYYTISKTSVLSWNLHTRTLVIKFADSQTIEWIKVHE